MSDEEALRAAALGEGGAFEVVFDRYASPAYRYASSLLGDAAAAEDAVQEAFFKLFAHARNGGFDPRRGSARGLLYRMVRNACVDRFRGKGPATVSLEVAHAVPSAPEDGAAARLDVEAALVRLPEQQRSALLLRAEGGLSYAEISSALGASVAQVKTWIFRGRREMAQALGLEPRMEVVRDGM
jgi:RNA polymerase sigma-70 factor (ECF subfamily)